MTAHAREKNQETGREELVIINPATLEELDRVPLMTSDEVAESVKRAEAAFPAWATAPVAERAKFILRARDYMVEHVDEIARTITEEMGKPRVESLVSEVMVAADLMGHFATRAEEILADQTIPIHLFKVIRQSYVTHEPLGVVSIISPWNYPFSIHMSSIVFALLAGNTVVAKAASDATLIGRRIEEIFRDGAKLPEGVLELVVAPGSSIGTALYEPPVSKVVFTGSTETGTQIMREAAKHLIPVTLELGGKDAMIVLPDADLERAAGGAVWGAFSNCGQTCASVERLYVHRSIYDEFVGLVTKKVEALRLGNGLDPDVDIGPMANEKQLALVVEHVNDALDKGARVLTGGKRPEHLAGLYFEPTVLVDVTPDMRCVQEETFGPTLPIMAYDTIDEVVEWANDSDFGLTASVWTQDRAHGERIARRLEAGTVSINDHMSSYGLTETPWQGVKKSGIGVSHSDRGLLAFTHAKHIAVDRIPLKASPWWFPYSQTKYDAFKSGIKVLLGSKTADSVFDGLRDAIGTIGAGGELNTKAWQAARKTITGGNGECQEEEPPEKLWSAILWASTPCETTGKAE